MLAVARFAAVLVAISLSTTDAQPLWNRLRVTFGMNPFNAMNFAALPRTIDEARRSGWIADASVTCGSGSAFLGNRFIHNGDTSAMLLFDRNGYIAGIQAGIPKALPNGYPAPNLFKMWIEESSQWTITAYFVEPSIICTSGRSAPDFRAQGTGTMLILQAGPNAVTNRIVIPRNETDLVGTMWTKGRCFYMMGMHYWYNLSLNMTTDEFFPAFLLYNRGQLNAFGWAFNADIKSNRYEHPPKSAYSSFMVAPPTSLMQLPHGVSTMHIYMTNAPRLNMC